MPIFTLTPGELSLQQLRLLWSTEHTLALDPNAIHAIKASRQTVCDAIATGKTIYGINTGFGSLVNTLIKPSQQHQLQYNLIQSHAAGVGALLEDHIVRFILLLKINSLSRGYSGVRLALIEALMALHNARIYPCIPGQGSVGASGDLAPLAHLSLALIGKGEVHYQGEKMSAQKALTLAGLTPIELHEKEGLALLNGLQVSTALALHALFLTDSVFQSALIAGSLSVDAAAASVVPFDDRVQHVRAHPGQRYCAQAYRNLLHDSSIQQSHKNCDRIQDPYSLRCQPQVMGACWDQMQFVTNTLLIEANAVSDNPLVFSDSAAVLSAGNFHGQAIAMAADNLALVITEIASLSERRIALLMDPHLSGLPPFLVKESGLNSGFMVAQTTAAALVSENKCLSHPASIDTIPTSANQEDHVSMACHAARRLLLMIQNTATVIGIELLAACQGIDLRSPLNTSTTLEDIKTSIRQHIPMYTHDRELGSDIAWITQWVLNQKKSE